METRYKLSAYVMEALDEAVYQRMDRGGFTGRIPSCLGVEAVGRSLLECEDELRSTLEEWIVVEMRLQRPLPVLNGIDLNQEPSHEPLDAV
jgi:predicted RNase H-like HicB family nuclease